MTNAIFAIFAAVALLRGLFREERRGRLVLWMVVSVLAFAQIGQKAIPGVLALLGIQSALLFVANYLTIIKGRFFPLVYATILLSLNAALHLNLPGFSYLVLSSSIDLWFSFNNAHGSAPAHAPAPIPVPLRSRAFNLFSFAKTVVGPITGSNDLSPRVRENSEIFRVAFWGVLKAFVLVNLWRQYVLAPEWIQLHAAKDYLWFGLWNYVNLFLEFSGICDLVAASFWLLDLDCPLNFEQPYLAFSVSEFWKRWHITLSRWIRNFVYIPFGGSRVSTWRIYLNLMLAMSLSGLWHGMHFHYLAWGALQGVFLCVERWTGHEQRIRDSGGIARGIYWLITQTAVTLSWLVFFAKF